MALPESYSYVGHYNNPDLPERLVDCESMDLRNDARFYRHSTLDKRLKAFHSLTILAGIMIGVSFSQCMMTPKGMNLQAWTGWMALGSVICFLLVSVMNVFTMLVLILQLFFTYRLKTAGFLGFEVAASFYLNKNIVQYRHIAVKGMMSALPLFTLGSGMRFGVEFWVDSDKVGKPAPPPEGDPSKELNMAVHLALAEAIFVFMAVVFLCLCCVYRRHLAIFRERYRLVYEEAQPLLDHVTTLAQRTGGDQLDN